MNPLPRNMNLGTIGELLTQLRLLEHGVQAAPPLKDTGNDLIAVRGPAFRALQVKTTASMRFRLKRDPRPRRHDAVVFVRVVLDAARLQLDSSRLFIVSSTMLKKTTYSIGELEEFDIQNGALDRLFSPTEVAAQQAHPGACGRRDRAGIGIAAAARRA